MSTNNNLLVAEDAIRLLRRGINTHSRTLILAAYKQVEHDSFSWDDLEVAFMEWNDLVDEANDILYV